MQEPVHVSFQIPTQESTGHQFLEPRGRKERGQVDTVPSRFP
jgi:hypothetical protein